VQTLDYRYLDFSTGTKSDDDVFLESNNSFTARELRDILNRVELFGLSNNLLGSYGIAAATNLFPRKDFGTRLRWSHSISS
jgi:hypothetical protein